MSRTRIALIIPAHADLALDRAFPIDDLPRLQKAVGGYIELVRLDAAQLDRAERLCGVKLGAVGHVFLVVNEEGKHERPRPLPLNMVATMIYGQPHDVIVGDALITEMPPDYSAGQDDGA